MHVTYCELYLFRLFVDVLQVYWCHLSSCASRLALVQPFCSLSRLGAMGTGSFGTLWLAKMTQVRARGRVPYCSAILDKNPTLVLARTRTIGGYITGCLQLMPLGFFDVCHHTCSGEDNMRRPTPARCLPKCLCVVPWCMFTRSKLGLDLRSLR